VQARFFIPAEGNGGRFRFVNLPDTLSPELLAPLYQGRVTESDHQPGVNDLAALGYQSGTITSPAPGRLLYRQQAWEMFLMKLVCNGSNHIPECWKVDIM
jgi:alpha-L-fucosidase 2